MRLIFLFLSVSLTFTALSQTKTGTVVSFLDNTPIAYVNIYSKKSTKGTVTNDEGNFKLNYTEPSDSIIISHLGYRREIYHVNNFFENISDTIYLKPKAVELSEVIVFGGDPRNIVKKAVSNLRHNYPIELGNIMSYFRSMIKENEEFVFFTEGAALITNTSYLKKKEQESRIQVYDARSSTNKSKIFTSFTASLRNNIGAISFYENKPFLSKDLSKYEFKIEGIIPLDNFYVYAIKFEPNSKLKRQFIFEGMLYVETKSNAFVKMDYTIKTLSKKFTFIRYKGMENEYSQTYISDKYEILFRMIQEKWGISYVNTETLSTIKFKQDNSEIKLLAINQLLISNLNPPKTLDNSKAISFQEDIYKHSGSFDDKMWEDFNTILPNKQLRILIDIEN